MPLRPRRIGVLASLQQSVRLGSSYVGSTFPGNIFGEVTSWEGSLDGVITLNIVGKLVGFPGGHPQDVQFSVNIQRFGGAGVGQWTLSIGGNTVCFETLLSGQIFMRRSRNVELGI